MSIPDSVKTVGKYLSDHLLLVFVYYLVLLFLFFYFLSSSGGFGTTVVSILYSSIAIAACLALLHRYVMQAQQVSMAGLIARGVGIVVTGGLVFGLIYRVLQGIVKF